MSRTILVGGTALIAFLAAGIAVGAGAGESAVPNLASSEFGWQPASGLDFLPVEGTVAPVGHGNAQWRTHRGREQRQSYGLGGGSDQGAQ